MSHRPAWFLLVAGAVLGATAATGISTVFAHRVTAVPRSPSPYQIEADAVRLRAPGPFRFDTAVAESGPPLSRPPVTARVSTREQLTAPSFAPLDGRVAEVAVRIGDHVKQGDKMVLVRSGDLASLQRDLKAAQLSIQTKQALEKRIELLVEGRAASQNELLVAQSELAEAKLVAQAASSRLRSLSVRPEGDSGYWVLAPRAGTVVQLDATAGKQVGPDREHPVATIADLDEVLVVADLPQKDAAVLDPGGRVVVRLPGSQVEVAGTIEVVSDVLDPDRQTVPVRVRVGNEAHKLRAYAFVEATFSSLPDERILQVPAEAVVSDGSTSVVFVETEPGVLRRRPVQLGRQSADKAEIMNGISAGDRVVVKGALLLLNALDVKG